MKFVIVMVSNEDAGKVVEVLSVNRFYVSRMNSTGQFLKGGHTTLIIGVESQRVDELVDIVNKTISKRTVTSSGVESTLEGSLLRKPIQVTTGGATIFVLDVERFEKL